LASIIWLHGDDGKCLVPAICFQSHMDDDTAY